MPLTPYSVNYIGETAVALEKNVSIYRKAKLRLEYMRKQISIGCCGAFNSIQVSRYIFGRDFMSIQSCTINPFVPNARFLYPLKTSENLKFF